MSICPVCDLEFDHCTCTAGERWPDEGDVPADQWAALDAALEATNKALGLE